jgi:hypothetical protein
MKVDIGEGAPERFALWCSVPRAEGRPRFVAGRRTWKALSEAAAAASILGRTKHGQPAEPPWPSSPTSACSRERLRQDRGRLRRRRLQADRARRPAARSPPPGLTLRRGARPPRLSCCALCDCGIGGHRSGEPRGLEVFMRALVNSGFCMAMRATLGRLPTPSTASRISGRPSSCARANLPSSMASRSPSASYRARGPGRSSARRRASSRLTPGPGWRSRTVS